MVDLVIEMGITAMENGVVIFEVEPWVHVTVDDWAEDFSWTITQFEFRQIGPKASDAKAFVGPEHPFFLPMCTYLSSDTLSELIERHLS